MGETPKITDPLEALEAAARAFEEAPDFTIGVEEEFAILEPERLNMIAGFERFDAATDDGAARGDGGRASLSAPRSRCAPAGASRFAEAAETMARRRVDLLDVADRLGYRLSAAGTHPFARWQDQEVIDTPHYHLVESTLRYVAWRNNTFGIHVHTGIRGADRAIAVSSALRSVLPELLAVVVQLAVAGGPPHAPAVDAHADLHPLLPPLRHPRPVRRLGRVRRTSCAS